jgi:outer membrane lipoprotein-sorting protein
MRSLRPLPLVTLVAFAASAGAQNPAVAAIDKAVVKWAQVTSSRGTIEQTVTNSLVGSTATSHAEFQQQRPNRLSIRFTDLKGDAIVSDGTWLWIYLPTGLPGQVERRPAKELNGLPVDPGQFLDSPKARYDIVDRGTAAVGGRTTRVVGLTTKAGVSSPFTKATVWIDEGDGSIRQFEAVQSDGVTRRVRFTSLTLNGAVDAAAFKFTVPAGVKVVNR